MFKNICQYQQDHLVPWSSILDFPRGKVPEFLVHKLWSRFKSLKKFDLGQLGPV